MGIPVYFKNLLQDHSNKILQKPKTIHNVFFDLNCLLHPCCSSVKSGDELEMIQTIKQSIQELIDFTGVTDLIYIAIDGPAPRAKMEQQKQRRFKNSLEEKIWDTSAITPGTYFMKQLNKELNLFITSDIVFSGTIILSDSTEPGEGEHKILTYLKQKKQHLQDQTNIIYGLDADLIMLALVSEYNHIYLLREKTEYNIENLQGTYIYLDISILKQKIIDSFDLQYDGLSHKTIIQDYIFICFFLGNDFIKHIPSLQLRYSGLDYLLSVYKTLQKRYSGYFYLIQVESNSILYLPFLKEFIYELSNKEDKYVELMIQIRKKQSSTMKLKYNEYYEAYCQTTQNLYSVHDQSTFIKSSLFHEDERQECSEMYMNLPILDRHQEEIVFQDMKQWRKRYYQMIELDITIEELCETYIQSILWTTYYYFKECYSWSYYYPFHYTPTLQDINKYLHQQKHIVDMIQKDNQPWTAEQQVRYVMPLSKFHLFTNETPKQEKIDYKTYSFMKRYLWECEISFPRE